MIKKILITGGSGLCGSVLFEGLSKNGYKVKSCDINSILSPAAKSLNIKTNKKINKIDLRNMSQVLKATKGIDAVVHFGGIARHKPSEDKYKNIIDHNIIGTYNVFEASRINKVKRVIFASSAHTMGYHDRRKKLTNKSLFRPDSHYGVSKCFGETVASFYADKFNIKSMSIRIGSVLPKPTDKRFLSTWISYRDLVQLVNVGLKNKKLHCSTVYGVSKNKRSWWNNKNAYKLGYKPLDNAEKYINSKLTFNESKDKIALKFHGGVFTSDCFKGNVKNILQKK
ncbi:MAG: uronate dehydrogenase [Pelagibacterales bacterium]|nr:uronate dehydrogenase [Pelagibacterales bacterium]